MFTLVLYKLDEKGQTKNINKFCFIKREWDYFLFFLYLHLKYAHLDDIDALNLK